MATLNSLYKLLEQHDWYYEYSDDFSVWRRGQRQKSQINNLRIVSDEHEELFQNYRSFVFGQDEEKYPCPEEPKDK
jgi:hypothetical protein